MCITRVLRGNCEASVEFGANRSSQLLDNIKALDNLFFDSETLETLEEILKK